MNEILMVLFKALVYQRKVSALILVMQRQGIVLVYNGDNSYLYVSDTEIYKFKTDKKSQLSESILSEKNI